jgi:hypothetical protein
MISLALENYHAEYQAYPPAVTYDANGRAMHSWRVLLLPYLDAAEVYARYRMDEPWNSENNLRIEDVGGLIFSCHGKQRTTDTDFLAVTGPNTAWPDHDSRKHDDFANGGRNTIMVVAELGAGIHWMEPSDLSLQHCLESWNKDADRARCRDMLVIFADGEDCVICSGTNADVLSAMLRLDNKMHIRRSFEQSRGCVRFEFSTD